jgi:hypothetical protein
MGLLTIKTNTTRIISRDPNTLAPQHTAFQYTPLRALHPRQPAASGISLGHRHRTRSSVASPVINTPRTTSSNHMNCIFPNSTTST